WGVEKNRDGQSQAEKARAADRVQFQQNRGAFGGRGGFMGRGRGGRFDSWRDKPQRIRVASVEIRADWTSLDGSNGQDDFTMSLPQMEKLKMEKLKIEDETPPIEDDLPPVEELACVGNLFTISKNIDKASTRAAIALKKLPEPKAFHLAVTDDPIFQKLASQGKASGKATMFTTDVALGVLMAAPRSTISWDMVVLRAGGSIFLDIREGSSIYDTTVNETAQDAPDDENPKDMNSMTALATEAGYINYCYSQQTLDRTALATEAGYINYCYSQQTLDRTVAPQSQDRGAKELRDAWSQGTTPQTLPNGKALR
ncbi:eukaryotic translation initiation factor 3 subunit D, partial [Baffinella frigidus]